MEKIRTSRYRDDYCLNLYIETEIGLLICITKTPRQNKYVGWRDVDYFVLSDPDESSDFWQREPVRKINIKNLRKFIMNVFKNCTAANIMTEEKIKDYLKDK